MANGPESQIAMVLAKCDVTRSERPLDNTQAQVHAALTQALGVAQDMERVTYYRASARTTRGVDDLFRDIGESLVVLCAASKLKLGINDAFVARKLRKESTKHAQNAQTLSMEID